MKDKAIWLFLICFTSLIFLQGYYIYISYQLKDKELNKQAFNISERVLDKIDKEQTEASEDSLVRSFKNIKNGSRSVQKKITELKQWYAYRKFFLKEADAAIGREARGTHLDIALRNEIYSIYDVFAKKELLNSKSPLLLFKTKKDVKKGYTINVGLWNSKHENEGTQNTDNYHFLIKSRTVVEVLNIRYLIFKQILPLALTSILTIVLINYLFWRSLKNLRKQQTKIAQLHTTIDSIAHEINTPITTLKFAIANSRDNEEKKLLNRQIQRLENIVSNIHHHDGETDLVTEAFLLNYLSYTKKQFPHLSFQKTVQFQTNHYLQQKDFENILGNLVDNASKYYATEVQIILLFDQQIEMTVADNGIGIPEEAQAQIFEKYYRVTRPENFQVNGLGIGLHLVKTIIEKYRGTIAVKSDGKKGTSFQILIPNEN